MLRLLVALVSVVLVSSLTIIIIHLLKPAQHIGLFESAFDYEVENSLISDPTFRKWYGGETFCLVAEDENGSLQVFATQFIHQLSVAFSKNFKVWSARRLEDCPSYTTFYGLLLEDANYHTFQSAFELLLDTSPNDSIDWESQYGFSVTLPGSRSRELFYVDSSLPAQIANESVSQSIFLEEFFHAMTGGDDIFVDEIVSILGNSYQSDIHADWYLSNPTGYCEFDFILLDLLLGERTAKIRTFEQITQFLKENYRSLQLRARSIGGKLQDYSDPRCNAF